jgi:hypothetical protein
MALCKGITYRLSDRGCVRCLRGAVRRSRGLCLGNPWWRFKCEMIWSFVLPAKYYLVQCLVHRRRSWQRTVHSTLASPLPVTRQPALSKPKTSGLATADECRHYLIALWYRSRNHSVCLIKSVKLHTSQEETTLNGSEPPLSSPANTARLTAPKYSASLRPSGCKKSS